MVKISCGYPVSQSVLLIEINEWTLLLLKASIEGTKANAFLVRNRGTGGGGHFHLYEKDLISFLKSFGSSFISTRVAFFVKSRDII